MSVPFLPFTDPHAGYLAQREEVDAAVRRVLEGGRYILGPEVRAFEDEFGRFVGADHAVGVASGTDALHLALRALGVGPGDAVLTVSHTAVATVAAIEMSGAQPVLLDVEPDCYTLNPQRVEETLRNWSGPGQPRVLLPVHLYGQSADMPALLELARRYGLRVIEDCAQAHGATLAQRPVGSWGDLAAFSFYPTKNLGAFGDGGAVVTADRSLAERLRELREYGWRERYVSASAGFNSRLDELQAAILRVRLRQLPADNATRRRLAALYEKNLRDGPWRLPCARPSAEHVYHLYVIRCAEREAVREVLQRQGVGTGVHYPVPVHLQPAYSGRIALGAGGLGETERLCHEILSLPMFPQLRDDQVLRVTECLKASTSIVRERLKG